MMDFEPGEFYVDSDSDTESVSSTTSSTAGAEPCTRLYVGWKSPLNVTKQQLKQHFEKQDCAAYVPSNGIQIVFDRVSKNPKNFAFVKVIPAFRAEEIIQKLNGSLLLGSHKIVVKPKLGKRQQRGRKQPQIPASLHRQSPAKATGQPQPTSQAALGLARKLPQTLPGHSPAKSTGQSQPTSKASFGNSSAPAPSSHTDSGSRVSAAALSGEFCKVYVGVRLPPFIDEGHLRAHFREFESQILVVELCRDAATKASKGFGFVTFSSQDVAIRAVQKLNGSNLLGKFSLKVELDKGSRRRSSQKAIPYAPPPSHPGAYAPPPAQLHPGPYALPPTQLPPGHYAPPPTQLAPGPSGPPSTQSPPGHYALPPTQLAPGPSGPPSTQSLPGPYAPPPTQSPPSPYGLPHTQPLQRPTEFPSSQMSSRQSAGLHEFQDITVSSNTVIIEGLSPFVSEDELSAMVEPTILECTFREVGPDERTAVVTFSSLLDASNVAAALNGKSFLGRTVRASVSTSKQVAFKPTQSCSVKVTHLAATVTEAKLRQHFQSAGEITGCSIKSSQSLYAYVNFVQPEAALRAVSMLNRTVLDGSVINVKLQPNIKITSAPALQQSQSPRQACSVIVTHLPPTATEAKLRQHFESAGEITGCFIKTSKSLYAYVNFSHPEAAQFAVAKLNESKLDGWKINVKLQFSGGATTIPSPQRSQPPFLQEVQTPPLQQSQPPTLQEIQALPLQRCQPPSLQQVGPPLQQGQQHIPSHRLGPGQPQPQSASPNHSEKRMSFKPDQWNRLVTVGPHGSSPYQRLMEPYKHNPSIKIELIHEELSLSFTGSPEAVDGAFKHFSTQLNEDLSVPDRMKMQALVNIFPDLASSLSQKYDVTISGYQESSSCVHFDGLPLAVDSAHKEVESLLQQYCVCDLNLPDLLSPQLFASAQKRLKQQQVQVYLQPPVHPDSKCFLYSFSKMSIDKARVILQVRLIEARLSVSPAAIAQLSQHREGNVFEKLSNDFCVKVETNKNYIVICGFDNADVQHIHRTLSALVKEHSVIEKQLSCSLEEAQYIDHFLSQATKDSKVFLQSLPCKVRPSRDAKSIYLSGSQEAIQKAEEKVKAELLSGLQYRTFIFTRSFMPLIHQSILNRYKGRAVFIETGGSTSPTQPAGQGGSKPAYIDNTVSITMYTSDAAVFGEVCIALESLDPTTRRVPLHPKAVECAMSFASKCEASSRVKVHPGKTAVFVKALTKDELDESCERIKEHVGCTFEKTDHIQINSYQAKYLWNKRDFVSALEKECQMFRLPNMKYWNEAEETRSVVVKGTLKQTESVKQKLEECIDLSLEQFEVTCEVKFRRMWIKRWKALNREQEEGQDSEVRIFFQSKAGTEDGAVVTVSFAVLGPDPDQVRELKETILTEENGQTHSYKEISLTSVTISTLLRGLKQKDLNPEETFIVKMDIDRSVPKVTLTSPRNATDDLNAAEVMIQEFLGIHTVAFRDVAITDLAVGLILNSRPFSRHMSNAIHFAKPHHVSVQVLKRPRCGFALRGNKEALDLVEPLIRSQILEVIAASVGEVVVSVEAKYAAVFRTSEFSRFNSRDLQDKLCVVGTFPKCQSTAKVLRKTLLQPSSTARCISLEICVGNLIDEDVDAIVNAANRDLNHIGGLAKAILDVGGPSIQEESMRYVQENGKVKDGTVACLGAGNLRCKRVIHAVGPRWHGGTQNEEQVLYFTVFNALTEADKQGLGSIALPSISTGVFGVPEEICARTSLKAVRDFCQTVPDTSVHTVKFVLFVRTGASAFTNVFDTAGILDTCKVTTPASSTSVGIVDATTVSLSAAPSYQWQWQNDDGLFLPYDTAISSKLTGAYLANPNGKVTVGVGSTIYVVDLSIMMQTNVVTNYRRKVKYVPTSSSVGLPENVPWYYYDDKGQMEAYPDDKSAAIEAMYKASNPQALVINERTYIFDFDRMCQINMSTYYKRPIQRGTNTEKHTGTSHAPATASSVDSEAIEAEEQPRQNLTITLRGPKENLEAAKAKLFKHLESNLRKQDYLLPAKLPVAVEKRLLGIAKKSGVKCTIKVQSSKGGKSQQVLVMEGLVSAVQRATSSIQQEIIEYQATSDDSSLEVPKEWEVQTTTMQVFSLSRGSPEWSRVEGRMRETMPNVTIREIKRIQNSWLWQKYVHHKKMLHQKNNRQINERDLFHGTRGNDPKNIYDGDEGFDMRFSASGMWGQANYFAVNASYSNSYAHQASNGCMEIFLANVLTGESHECPPNSSLRKPPAKQGGATAGQVQLSQVNYDTVTGHTGGSQVYMAYDNLKAYPAYLICYSR